MSTTTVVIGAGGLLGTAAIATAPGESSVVPITGLPWTRPDRAGARISDVLAGVLAAPDRRPLLVLWCAGGGRVGTDAAAMATELELLTTVVSDLVGMAGSSRRISFCLASSAGGVWSGSPERILHEGVPARPWHDYGRGKLAQEAALTELVAGSGVTAVVARISNLHGRPRDGRPLTGLVNHLVHNALHRRPTGIYVPLDTQRDWLSAHDAAHQLHDLTTEALDAPAGTTRLRVVAAGRSVTISQLATVTGRVLGRRIPITVGHSPIASQQPRALAFRSNHRDLSAAGSHLAHDLQLLVRNLLTWRP